MKILVTGAAGAIGSHLAERLIAEGHDVYGIDALTSYYNPGIKRATAAILEGKGVRMVYEDLAIADLAPIVRDMEVVFHLAAQPGISAATPFEDYLRNNIIATHSLLDSLKDSSSLKLFVNASTSSVYGALANGPETTLPAPTSNYGVTKLAAEQLALSYQRSVGMPVVNIRFFSVYGERERPEKFFFKLIKAMFEDAEIMMYEGSDKHVRSYSYVGDIIEGCVKVLNNYPGIIGETFNLGTDITNTTAQGVGIIEDIMGKKAKIKIVPKRLGDQLETGARIEKIKKLIGYEPHTDLQTGLRKEVEWYGKEINGKF